MAPPSRESRSQEPNPGLLAVGCLSLPTCAHHLWGQVRKGQLGVTYPLPPSRFLRRRRVFAEEDVQAQRGGLTCSGLHSLSVPWGLFETWCLLSWLFGTMVNPAAWTGPFPAFLPLTLSIHLVRLRLKPVTCQALGVSMSALWPLPAGLWTLVGRWEHLQRDEYSRKVCSRRGLCPGWEGQEGLPEVVFKLGWRCRVGVSGPGTSCPSLKAREPVCSWK